MSKNRQRNNLHLAGNPKSMQAVYKDESYVLLDWESSDIESMSCQDETFHNYHSNLIEDFNLNKDHENQQKISARQFEKKTLSRFEDHEKKRISKMMNLKEERYLEESKELTLVPKIHNMDQQNDKDFVGKKHENLVDRLDKIILDKKSALQKERNKRLETQEKEELKECSFTPNINKSGPKRSMNDLFQWQKNRQEKIFKESNKCSKDASFKPSISKKSIMLINQNATSESRSRKVEDRLLGYLQKKNRFDDEASSCFSNTKCNMLSKKVSQKSFVEKTNQQARRMMSAKNLHVHQDKETGLSTTRDLIVKSAKEIEKDSNYLKVDPSSAVKIRMIPRSKSQSQLLEMRKMHDSKLSEFSITKEQEAEEVTQILHKNNDVAPISTNKKKKSSLKLITSSKRPRMNPHSLLVTENTDEKVSNQMCMNAKFDRILDLQQSNQQKFHFDENEIGGVNDYMKQKNVKRTDKQKSSKNNSSERSQKTTKNVHKRNVRNFSVTNLHNNNKKNVESIESNQVVNRKSKRFTKNYEESKE